jgi:hypothetical protein
VRRENIADLLSRDRLRRMAPIRDEPLGERL